VTTRGRLLEAEEFGNIVLRSSGPNGALRLKDVARIELGAQSYDATNSINGQPAIALAVFLATGANALQVGDAVKGRMAELKQERFPPDIDYSIPYDTTRFVSASIKEVMYTILEAAVIVLIVVFVFLQTWRATLIPMLAVPVSLVGTFAGLWLFGFSINTLTLFAMVLAIGIVVDDAIVVLENVERLIRTEKMTPMAAAIEAMREVQGAVIGIVLALCAVFIPVAFLGGIAGQLYRQFAVTVTVAVVLSGVVALTLTPALCALLLKPGRPTTAGRRACSGRSTARSLGHRHFVARRRSRCATACSRCSLRGDLAVARCCCARCRAASCRRRTRATSSRSRCCPTARRSSARRAPPSSCAT
jgi:multidrug efflux pump subunit AcrB